MTTSEREIYAAEYATCGATTHEARDAHARHAVDIDRYMRSTRERRQLCQRTRPYRPNPAARARLTVDLPSNSQDLVSAAQTAACAFYGIAMKAFSAPENYRARYFAITALTVVPADHRAVRKGVLGSERARRMLGEVKPVQWVPKQLREYDNDAWREATTLGENLTAKWDGQPEAGGTK